MELKLAFLNTSLGASNLWKLNLLSDMVKGRSKHRMQGGKIRYNCKGTDVCLPD